MDMVVGDLGCGVVLVGGCFGWGCEGRRRKLDWMLSVKVGVFGELLMWGGLVVEICSC